MYAGICMYTEDIFLRSRPARRNFKPSCTRFNLLQNSSTPSLRDPTTAVQMPRAFSALVLLPYVASTTIRTTSLPWRARGAVDRQASVVPFCNRVR